MIQLQINNKKMYIDGKEVVLDVPPLLVDDSRTLVPIRAVAEGLGQNVEWDNDTQTVTIYGRKKYFDTIDECAYDWAMHWNAMSIAVYKEITAVIYKDNNGYYWNDIRLGQDKNAIFDTVKAKKGVALIHSHGGGQHSYTKDMSKDDKTISKRLKKPLYMVDSGGCLWVYNPTEDKPSQKLIIEGLPKDARWEDVEESSATQRKYFEKGYHDLSEYDMGFKADYYNKLHMRGLNYLEERAE